ncbi:MAG: DUF255 domain-containing protein [Verrucomicrobiota bacterium]
MHILTKAFYQHASEPFDIPAHPCHSLKPSVKPFLCIILTILALSSCRKEESKPPSSQDTYFQNPPETIAELAQPDLAKEPTDFLRSAQNSPINWQPWTKEVFNFAERSQRLVFLFVGSNSYSNSSQVISILENKFAEKLNNDYVPVLADTEADPALAIACHLLALERNESITFPFLLWLSHEGNPVAWLPISVNEEDSLLSGFNRALLTVETIVDKSIEYVINNSRYDNERRVNLINSSKIPDLDPLRRSSLAQHLRLLNGYYDPVTGLFDRTGGLPPANLITTLTRTAQHPAISNSQRQEALSSCRNALETLSKTAIFDPLQNRFFQRRLSRSFSIPDTTTHTLTQSGLLNAFSSIDLQPAAQFAHDSLLSLARNPIPASTSINNPTVSKDCFFWTKNQLKELLSPEEFKLASFLFKLHELGNIPSSDDPTRLYFRKNSLGFRQSIADYASANNQPLTSTQTLFESLRTKLADNRAERLAASGSLQTENTLSLSNQAQLLTSLCRNYGKSPNAEILALADALAAQLRTKFRDSNGRLLHFPREAGLRQVPAFASDYATLLEALLESYRLKWDPALLVESRNLASELLDEFANEQGLLHE